MFLMFLIFYLDLDQYQEPEPDQYQEPDLDPDLNPDLNQDKEPDLDPDLAVNVILFWQTMFPD